MIEICVNVYKTRDDAETDLLGLLLSVQGLDGGEDASSGVHAEDGVNQNVGEDVVANGRVSVRRGQRGHRGADSHVLADADDEVAGGKDRRVVVDVRDDDVDEGSGGEGGRAAVAGLNDDGVITANLAVDVADGGDGTGAGVHCEQAHAVAADGCVRHCAWWGQTYVQHVKLEIALGHWQWVDCLEAENSDMRLPL